MVAIKSPTLLLDKHIAQANIERMAGKARENNLTFKPHFKTHQSREIGKWFKAAGVEKITVSSIRMAEYFASAGWNDITIAFPVNVLEIDRINTLAAKIDLTVLISDAGALPFLQKNLNHHLSVYVEIDTGSDRTGFRPDQQEDISSVLEVVSNHPRLNFKGFYSHPGHSYSARSKDEIKEIHRDAVAKMQGLKSEFKNEYPDLVCCIGDTPCCSVADNWNGIDEMSPGNFVFYDLMQTRIGACKPKDIAVALACPVVATCPERNEIVVHAGAVHLSKDFYEVNGDTCFGEVVRLTDEHTWDSRERIGRVKSISQEHGIISCEPGFLENTELGEVIGILPVHSCLTADTMKSYTLAGSFDEVDHMQSTTQ